MSVIDLDEEKSFQLLKNYTELAFSCGKFTINDGAILSKYFRVLTKKEVDDSLPTDGILNAIFGVLVKARSEGTFNLDDSAVLDIVIKYITKHVLKKDLTEPAVVTPKVTEL